MTPEKITDIRMIALQQACHDFKGQSPHKDVLERAESYFNFMTANRFVNQEVTQSSRPALHPDLTSQQT